MPSRSFARLIWSGRKGEGMFFAAAWLALTACEVDTPDSSEYGGPAVPQARAWARAKRSLVDEGRRCFRGRTAYCPTDQAFSRQVIQYILDKNFDGVMPDRELLLQEVISESRGVFRRQLRTPEGLQATMRAIEAYYAEPNVERIAGHGVSVDLGVPPGKLSWEGEEYVLRSPHVEDDELVGTEVARLLWRYLVAYPRLPGVQLLVEVPTGPRDYAPFDIRYQRKVDRIVVYRPGNSTEAWATPELGGDLAPYIDGDLSLHTSDLIVCTTPGFGEPPDCPE